jgi:hypothetical protein
MTLALTYLSLLPLLGLLGHYLTFLIGFSKITKRPRVWLKSKSHFLNEMMSCSFCLGTWVGILFVAPASFLFMPFVTYLLGIFQYIFYVSACSLFSYYLDLLSQLLEKIAESK